MDPNTPCDTCAFKPGSVTHDSELDNRLRSQICELGALPFFCHHATDGRELDWHGNVVDYYASLAPAGSGPAAHRKQMRVCAGWKAAVAERKRRGFFGKYRIIRQAVARWALDSLTEFNAEETEPADKETARKHVLKCVRFLVKRNVGRLKIPCKLPPADVHAGKV